MRALVNLLLIASLACGLSACGNKGKLKSPSQIEHDEAKKAKKDAKAEQKKADEAKPEEAPATQPAPPATDDVQGVTKGDTK